MRSSDHLNDLAAALARVQAELKGAVKDSTNPFFKSKYADLESVWDSCREPLSKNGLSVIQGCASTENGPALVTRLLHVSGQWIEGVQPLAAKAATPQDLGSAITYARRYGLAAIVGVIQVDDDGETAQGRGSAGASKAARVTKEASRPQQASLSMAPPGEYHDNEDPGAFFEGKPAGQPTEQPPPVCCGKEMSISKYVDTQMGHAPYFCFTCKKKAPRLV